MKNIAKLALVALLGISVSQVQAQDKRAAAVLDAMGNKYKTMKSFQASFNYGTGGSQGQSGQVITKNGKFRLTMAGQEVYNDGKTLATYIRETNEVNLSAYEPTEDLNPAKIYTLYQKGYNYRYLGEKKMGTATVETVELIPQNKAAKVANVKITVSKTDKSIKGWEITDKAGKKQTFTIRQFTPNVAVSDAAFSFDAKKHPGVEVVDLRD